MNFGKVQYFRWDTKWYFRKYSRNSAFHTLGQKNENGIKYEEKNMVSNESVAKSCFTQKPSVRKKGGHRNASGTAQYANNLKSNQTQPSTELYLEIFSACASSHSWEETHFRVIFLTVPPMTSPVVGLPHESPSRRNAA